jgi:hypothetical protein
MHDLSRALASPLAAFRINDERLLNTGMPAASLVIADLKWSSAKPNRLPGYLEVALFMVLASLRAEGVRAVWFVPAFPLAFGLEQYNRHVDVFSDVCEKLSAGTGMQVAVRKINGKPLLIPESRAASAPYVPSDGQAVLMADIGGGTTDIAMIKNGEDSGDVEILAQDSIRFAGNQVIRPLAEYVVEARSSGSEDEDKKLRNKVEQALKMGIRTSGVRLLCSGEKLSEMFRADAQLASCMEELTETICREKAERFFDGILSYLRRIAEAKDVKNLILIPAGNGWRFCELFLEDADEGRLIFPITRMVKEAFAGSSVNVDIIDATSVLEEATALGVLHLLKRKDCSAHDPHTSPITTVVGDGVTLGGQHSSSHTVTPWTVPLRSGHPYKLLGLDEFFARLPVAWQNELNARGLAESKARLRAACHDIFKAANGGTVFSRGVLGRFLEELFVPFVMA